MPFTFKIQQVEHYHIPIHGVQVDKQRKVLMLILPQVQSILLLSRIVIVVQQQIPFMYTLNVEEKVFKMLVVPEDQMEA